MALHHSVVQQSHTGSPVTVESAKQQVLEICLAAQVAVLRSFQRHGLLLEKDIDDLIAAYRSLPHANLDTLPALLDQRLARLILLSRQYHTTMQQTNSNPVAR